ncbi:MAG: GWxTD domain-containing protein [Melioribacteraceae bacterium]
MVRTNIHKITFLFLFSFLITLSAQHKERQLPFLRTPIFLEKNIFFSDSSSICYFSYRIPFKELFFTKNDNKYTAGFVFDLEIKNANKIVDRKSLNKLVVVETYEETKTVDNFIQGVISFENKSKDYVIYPYLSITNSDQSIPLDSISVHNNLILKEKIGRPIVVQNNESQCESKNSFQLVNFMNTIPYSLKDYSILIPVVDSTANELNIKIEQDGKVKVNQRVTDYFYNEYKLKECDNKIVLYSDKKHLNTKYFVMKDFSYFLEEGNARLIISKDNSKPVEFDFTVLWNDKPKSLMNPEFAIQVLEAIESKQKIETLLDADKNEYAKVLKKYWDEKTGNKKFAFNELENEYYKRADYSIDNFSTVSYPNGVKSDRGKIYIKYGKPDEIKREYSNSNIVIEIWKYLKLKKEFTYTDKSGLGNYTLD